jgi:cytosine/adenosine deaminase-related metal-dependent hydrolase
MESRNALLLGRLRHGPEAMQARDALDMATRGGARCLGRDGEIGVLTVGAAGDLAIWPLEGVTFAGALSDPIEAWLRCGPTAPSHTIVAGRALVADGRLVDPAVNGILVRHRAAAARIQGLD